MTKRTKKRFVAGAICPKCKSMDTIMLFFENNVEKLECVQCDYSEVQTEQQVEKAKQRHRELSVQLADAISAAAKEGANEPIELVCHLLAILCPS